MQHNAAGVGGGGVGGGKAKTTTTKGGGGGGGGGAAGKTKNGKRRMTLRSGRAVLGDLSNKGGSQGGAVRRVWFVSVSEGASLPFPSSFSPSPFFLPSSHTISSLSFHHNTPGRWGFGEEGKCLNLQRHGRISGTGESCAGSSSSSSSVEAGGGGHRGS